MMLSTCRRYNMYASNSNNSERRPLELISKFNQMAQYTFNKQNSTEFFIASNENQIKRVLYT